MLFWVRRGLCHVEFEDRDSLHLAGGEGVWLPPTVSRRMHAEAGTVAFPMFVLRSDVATLQATPVRFDVPSEWEDRLIAHFSQSAGRHTANECAPLDVLGMLDRARRPRLTSKASTPTALPMPSSACALVVARALLADPADPSAVQDWAGYAGCSEWTLRRQFVGDTGLTFAQWRARRRTIAAAELLAAGYDVGHTAARVGFTDRTSFARAFHAHHGVTPRDFANRARIHRSEPTRPAPASRSRRTWR